ncbi:MAG: diacylglycerol kinase (ATP) [Candidatus Krumholzibacteriia bacterium]|jgi:diacylglycerol kinase (ATP)
MNGNRSESPAFDHALVIANPYSGHSKKRTAGKQALALVAPLGRQCELATTTGVGHATVLAQDWAARGNDLVVAVGGDGTIHEVAKGLVGTSCAMAVLPSGSGNDFATGAGCATVAESLQTIRTGENVAIDVAALDGEVFINSCGLLTSGLVSDSASKLWRWLGSMRYTLAAARTLFTYRGQEVSWKIEPEDKPAVNLRGRYLLAEICNGPLTGGGFQFAPDANFTDGQLDAALITPLSPWAGLKLVPAATTGEAISHPNLTIVRGQKIIFESALPIAYHLDGEPGELAAGRHEITVMKEKLLLRLRTAN